MFTGIRGRREENHLSRIFHRFSEGSIMVKSVSRLGWPFILGVGLCLFVVVISGCKKSSSGTSVNSTDSTVNQANPASTTTQTTTNPLAPESTSTTTAPSAVTPSPAPTPSGAPTANAGPDTSSPDVPSTAHTFGANLTQEQVDEINKLNMEGKPDEARAKLQQYQGTGSSAPDQGAGSSAPDQGAGSSAPDQGTGSSAPSTP